MKTIQPGDKVPAIIPAPISYLLDLRGYNPAAEAGKLGMPMLILQGERDYQVTMTDFSLWKSALSRQKSVVLRSFPRLNHLFIAGEGKSAPAEYQKPGHVDPEAIETIQGWITSIH